MKRLYSPLTIVAIILVLLGSCYYDSEEALYPVINSACDTTNVTFSGTIVSLLANNCLSCHSNATAAAQAMVSVLKIMQMFRPGQPQ